MRVLQVVPGLGISTGGPAVMVVDLCAALQAPGIESSIFSTDLAGPASSKNHRPAKKSDLPARVHEVDVRLFPVRWPYRLAFSPSLDRALSKEVSRCDVVHIHSLFLFPQFAAFRHSKRHGIPYVVSQHGALDPYLRRRSRVSKALMHLLWQRRLLEEAAALHVSADDEARTIADVAPHVRRMTVPFGIQWKDYEQLPEGQAFRERHLGGFDGPIVMNVGRIAEKKGLDVLVRAFADSAKEVPNARLVIVGPDDEGLRPDLVALAQREGIHDRVVFTGILRGKDLRAALAAADVWALPSRTEAFPMAVMEALAAGKPIVISRAVNIAPEIAAEGAGIVSDASPEAFAAEITSLLRSAERRAVLQARAREFARRFDWESVVPRWVEMYRVVATSA